MRYVCSKKFNFEITQSVICQPLIYHPLQSTNFWQAVWLLPESTHRQALDSGRNFTILVRWQDVRIAKETIMITGTEEHSNYMAFGKKLSTTIYQQWQRFYPVGCIDKLILIISSICHYTTAAF